MRTAVALLLAALGAAPLAAQQAGRVCRIGVDSVGHNANFVTLADGTQNVYAGGGVYTRCLDEPTTITADSMTYFQNRAEVRFIGNVHFRDSTSLLDADRLTYWTQQERMYAEGNVYTRNLRSGSEMRGPNMDYLRAVPPLRDTLEVTATGRPTIHFFSVRDTAAAREPFVVVADRVRMRHSDRMWARGRVTIDRSDLSARADSARLDLADSVAFLVGDPEVTGRDTTAADSAGYRLTGARIRFDLTGDDEIRRAVAVQNARATGPDWVLHGDTLDIALDSGQVQRAQVWGPVGDTLPTAHSGLSTVIGDSLDIQMPGQVMRLVWAYGRARADSRPDSTVADVDWLSGDTLRADFVAQDSAGRRSSVIDRVTATGTARAYYHVDNPHDDGGPRGISYSRGQRIRIAMADQKVRTVDVVGQMDGIYLEPLPLRPVTDSTTADSSRTGTAPAAAPDSTRRRQLPPPTPRPSDERAPRHDARAGRTR